MKVFYVFLCTIFILTAVPCTGSEPIKVGAIFSKTGAAAESNRMHLQAIRLALEEMNQQGGVPGGPLELLEFDNKSSAIGAKEAALKAVEAGVVGVIGASRSSHSLAMAPVLQKAGIPMISPHSTHPDVTLAGDCIFRICFTDSFQGSALALFARRDVKADESVVLINAGNQYSITLGEIFADHFSAQGGHVLWKQDYLPESGDYTELLKKVKVLNPKLVFLPGYQKDSAQIIKQSREMGISSIFLGGDGWMALMYEYAGSALHGSYFADHWHPSRKSTLSRHFVEAFTDKYGKINASAPALGYDAAMLLGDAIRRANSVDPKAVRKAIAETLDFEGVTGNIQFDHDGNRVTSALILKFEEGLTKLFKTIEPVKIACISNRSTFPIGFGQREPIGEVMDYSVNEINRRGGLLGRPVALIQMDNDNTAIGSRIAAQRAVKAGVIGVIGAFWSSQSLAMAPVLQTAGIPMITPTSTHPDVTLAGDCIFRVCFTDTFQAALLASFARDHLQARKAVVLTNTDRAYSIGLSGDFIRCFRNLGGEVVWEGDFKGNSKDFDEILERVESLQPDVIFVPSGNAEGGFIIKQARKRGIKTQFLGSDGWHDAIFNYGGEAVNGTYASENWHPASPSPVSKRFVESYREQAGDIQAYSALKALTFDAVMLLSDAVQRADSLEPALISKAMARTRDFQGVTGRLDFDPNGDPRKPAVIVEFRDGKAIYYQTVEPSAVAPCLE